LFFDRKIDREPRENGGTIAAMSYTKILVYDVETNGLVPNESMKRVKNMQMTAADIRQMPHILQLSFAVYSLVYKRVEYTYNAYIAVDDSVDISAEVTRINGIDRRICESRGVPICAALEAFYRSALECDCLIAHNQAFDRGVIYSEICRYKDRLLTCPGIGRIFDPVFRGQLCIDAFCTMLGTIDLCNIWTNSKYGGRYKKSPRLIELYRHLFIRGNPAPPNLHNAMADVMVCLRCYLRVAHSIDMHPAEFEHALNSI
jgi:DNA polymerase III epsilon subunit-like protein